MTKYRSVWHEGQQLYDLGILADGTLHNPRGYPDDLVRAAVLAADARCRQRHSEASKKAAVTRQRRQQKRTHQIAQRILAGHGIGERTNCAICGRGLDDPASVARGIGSECWQGVLSIVENLRTSSTNEAAE